MSLPLQFLRPLLQRLIGPQNQPQLNPQLLLSALRQTVRLWAFPRTISRMTGHAYCLICHWYFAHQDAVDKHNQVLQKFRCRCGKVVQRERGKVGASKGKETLNKYNCDEEAGSRRLALVGTITSICPARCAVSKLSWHIG
jgi:hypothetical protein